MVKVRIGEFATWEKQEGSPSKYHYFNNDVKRVPIRYLPIIDAIIENTLNNDNFINSNEIESKLKTLKNGENDLDQRAIKKALQRIREDEYWKGVIDSSHYGFRIKISVMSEGNEIVVAENSAKPIDDKADSSEENVQVEAETITESHVEDNVTIESLEKNIRKYISNFIKNKSRTRTYFYDATLKNLLDVYCPVSIDCPDDYKKIELNVNRLFEINEIHHYIISGPVGSGKSMMALHLGLEAARNYSELGLVPVIINLRTFSDSDRSLVDLLADEYESLIPTNEPRWNKAIKSVFLNSDFVACCEKGKALVLLDGLDELVPKYKTLFIDKLNEFLKNYNNNAVVIFSRPIGRFFEFESFNVLNICPFSQKDVSHMIDICIPSYGDAIESGMNEYMKVKSKEYSNSNYLNSNPLFLSILSSQTKKNLYLYYPDLNELIEGFIDCITYEDHFFQNKRLSKTKLRTPELKEIIFALCEYLVTRAIRHLDIGILDSFFRTINESRFSSEDFLDDLCRVYGFIVFADGKYRFLDEAILAYGYIMYRLDSEYYLSQVSSVIEKNSYSRIAYYIMKLLEELRPNYVERYVYCHFMNNYFLDNEDEAYKSFLLKYYTFLSYYVGEGNFIACNAKGPLIYSQMVKKFDIDIDINHLEFPALESLAHRAVYQLNKDEAQLTGLYEGLNEEDKSNSARIKQLNKEPVGYVYTFSVKQVFKDDGKDSKVLRDILMSKAFPLRMEFEKALTKCRQIINGET